MLTASLVPQLPVYRQLAYGSSPLTCMSCDVHASSDSRVESSNGGQWEGKSSSGRQTCSQVYHLDEFQHIQCKHWCITMVQHFWVSVRDLHTSAFDVEFCLYSMYGCTCIHWTVCHGWLSWSLVSRTITATMCSVSFIKQVCSVVRPHLSDADRGGGKGWPLSLGTNDPPHCTGYVLLPCLRSPHNVLHSPSTTRLKQEVAVAMTSIRNHSES